MHTKGCCEINFFAIYSDKRSVCIPILYTYIPRATVLRHGPCYVLVTVICLYICMAMESRYTGEFLKLFSPSGSPSRQFPRSCEENMQMGSVRCSEEDHLSASSRRVSFIGYQSLQCKVFPLVKLFRGV